MDLQQAYALAIHEINNNAQILLKNYHESSGGMMSIETAKEMAEKQWLFGNLYALTSKKKITKAQKKGEDDGKPTANQLPEL